MQQLDSSQVLELKQSPEAMQIVNKAINDRDPRVLELWANFVLIVGVTTRTDYDDSKCACTICNTGEIEKEIVFQHCKSDQHIDTLITVMKSATVE